MTLPRSALIDIESTPYYHVMTRCVRRSYLCGTDTETGKDYNHRKHWLITRMKYLANVFAIHISAYAVMSNHYHLVLYVNADLAKGWSDEEVISRWKMIFGSTKAKVKALPKTEILRERLSSISWFMRCLNENIARLSNREDQCQGRFWEGRFKSQALLDEGAVLSAMAYVDLNPIRSKMAATPEESEFTSIYERILELNRPINDSQANQLMAFQDNNEADLPKINITFYDYLELVDATGRILREDKPGKILEKHAPILQRLGLTSSGWLNIVKHLETKFFYALGSKEKLLNFGQSKGIGMPKGSRIAFTCYQKAQKAA
jgi:REP element-mobilizing transposase RayT